MYRLIQEDTRKVLYTGTYEECCQEKLERSLEDRYKGKSLVIEKIKTKISFTEVFLAFLLVVTVFLLEDE